SGRVPASTAMYVDEVYDGIGGGYDIGRMEVLRGPQGTLYGRSALGGVVSTFTNDPILNEFGGYITGEFGKAGLQNYQGALNVPLGTRFALRPAGQYLSRGEGYFNPDGGGSKSKAGRIKLLYQPSEELQIVLTGQYADSKAQSGGTSATLDDPDTINYSGQFQDVEWGALSKSTQGTIKINYEFPQSSLTYIGSYKNEKTEPSEGYSIQRTQIQFGTGETPGNKTHTEELRWASDGEGWWTWLLGSSYYAYDYGNTNDSWVVKSYMDATLQIPDPDPNTDNAYTHGGDRTGLIKQWGIFTEETFALTEKLQMTAGLRYDKTTVEGHEEARMNMNINQYGHEMNPANMTIFDVQDTLKYNNITWKLRFEYNLTPDNLLYASASTGFLPGDVRINSKFAFGPTGVQIVFSGMPMDEEKVTAYEAGSKNQFLDNRLLVNGAIFYYDYSEYRNPVNTSPFQMPTWAIATTPLRMIGAEIDTTWLVTQKDKVSFSAGYLDAKITEFPIDPFNGDTRQYLVFDRIENNPKWLININYDHVFSFANGSSLVPRVSARWQSGMYLSNLTQQQYDVGYEPYVWQDSYMVADLGATWTSSDGMYSASGYMRNLFDKEYKNGIGQLGTTNTLNTGVNVGDPRVWGVNLSIKF
ncbi:MAG: TonB-dependent receptor, partial [Deltaproteobacteria bacterium]|nr:TonB-dependent receptor [Deltaproteobacteria bacterium]